MKMTIIIPTRNNGDRVCATLRHLFHQTICTDHYEIVVVNNGSTDNTGEVLSGLQEHFVNLRCVTEHKLGRSHARNRGISESRGEVVLFLDDDIEVEANHLENHLAYHAQSVHPAAIIGQVVDFSPITPAWAEDYYIERQRAGTSGANVGLTGIRGGLQFATGNVSVLRTSLETIRVEHNNETLYFDPAFLFREDGDMGCRLLCAGVKFIAATNIVCRHYHPRSWQSITDRSYDGGYALVRLTTKHPELRPILKEYITSSRIINLALGAVCLGSFVPAYLVRSIWPQFLRKIIGGLVMYHTNRGFQHGLRDMPRTK
jgi:glycosyltransferase involved in cell wall biosynthesis